VETHRSGTQNKTEKTQPEKTKTTEDSRKQSEPNQQHIGSFMSENRKQKNQRKQKKKKNNNTTETKFGGTKLPTLMVGRKIKLHWWSQRGTKTSKAWAWRTKDREEGGEKPPSLDEHDSNSSSLSLER